ncbi:TPA: ead/Ea22-like family protein [Klebsiella aerogenes]|nr:ead/Ea22-like family protein [Klebsiella aerogenes]HDN2629944.1 ead/Ea22-like family protein [Klebsiella aerogenes]HDN2634639.1 ead/Ea22-like family protein [Klebsiella aerogenes]
MTTDITELAQSLKAAAEKAIGAHERLAAYPYGEIIDISQQEGEQIDIDITDINEFHEEANPANILALVEALEKAQQHIARQEQILLNKDESLSIRRGELEAAQQERECWRAIVPPGDLVVIPMKWPSTSRC